MAITLRDIKRYKDSFDFERGLEEFEKLSDDEKSTPNALRLKAEFYYQDKSRNTKERFEKALNILDSIKDDDNPDETNRLRGAIYKRRYFYTKDLNDIYRAIKHYNEALKTPRQIEADSGYGAGNVIYLYYLLINERRDNISDEERDNIESEAKILAQKSLKALEEKDKLSAWDYASIATLKMALGNAKDAKESFEEYIKLLGNRYDREYSITLTQFIKFYHLLPDDIKEKATLPLLEILEPFQKPARDSVANVIKSVQNGKKGLALSGGGFRASLFHIGILLSLAYEDKLRSIEVISTVSGGSIVGMGYYLMVKELLESKEDSEISKEDYIALVEKLRDRFIEAIQTNIRMRAFDKPISKPLTEHLGELYEREIYKRLIQSMPKSMVDIAISPKGVEDFNPHFHNELRANKVPRIIINATLLNNGHNWQFTQEGMGEQSYMIHSDTDMNEPYPFRRYNQICGDITIGEAIASSSAVPVVFDPIEIELYEGVCRWYRDKKETLLLSDGGVYDNLGLASIIQDECSRIIVSDGSKQLDKSDEPSNFRLDVLSRSNDILMNKIRDAEYQRVQSLYERGVVDTLSIYHLRKRVDDSALKEILDRCSKIRTDLDSFNDIESNALIYCGYRLASSIYLKKPKVIEDFESFYQKEHYKILEVLDRADKKFMRVRECYRFERFLLYTLLILSTLLAIFYPKIAMVILTNLFILVGILVTISAILYIVNKPLLKRLVNRGVAIVMRWYSKYYLKRCNSKYDTIY